MSEFRGMSGRGRLGVFGMIALALGACVLACPALAQAQTVTIVTANSTPTLWTVPPSNPFINGTLNFTISNGPAVTVVIGIRNANGNYMAGTTPQTGTTTAGQQVYPNATFTLLDVPTVTGTYYLWMHIAQTTNVFSAIAEFMTVPSPLLSPTQVDMQMGTVIVQPAAGITVDLASVTGQPWIAGLQIGGSMSLTAWSGLTTNGSGGPCIVVAGVRDAQGKWINGCTPQVILTDAGVPTSPPGKVYTQCKFAGMPTPAGQVCTLWVRLCVNQTDANAALAEFEAAQPDVNPPISNNPGAETAIDKKVGTINPPQPGMTLTAQTPTTWTVLSSGKTPLPITGMMTIQIQQALGATTTPIQTVVVGIRDNTGHWVGSNPVLLLQDTPPKTLPHIFPQRGFALTPPMTPGATYTVWARMVQTSAVATAIADFKASVVLAADQRNALVGTITVPSPAMTAGAATPAVFVSPKTRPVAAGSVTLTLKNGPMPATPYVVVAGIRNAAGAVVPGTTIQVLFSDMPPSVTPKTYANRLFSLTTPKTSGNYTTWVRAVQTSSASAAVLDFQKSVVVATDALNAQIATVTVP